VLGIGTLAVDEILTLEAFPAQDGKTRVLARERRSGGLVGTALVAAARLGASCAYAGTLGTDADSDFLRLALSAEGIDTACSVTDAAARPFHGTVLVVRGSGSRTILSERGESGAAALDAPPAAAVILVDHHTPERALAAIERLQQEGAQVVADLERATPQAPRIEALADHLIVPLAYARSRSGHHDPRQALAALWRTGRRLVAATDGADGAWALADGGPIRQPAFPVAARHTTGCGDVFHGAYAAGLSRRLLLADCLRQASAAAALHAVQGAPPDRESLAGLLAAEPAGIAGASSMPG
jgi:sugar/nucleoside kinase (ribokinase family)